MSFTYWPGLYTIILFKCLDNYLFSMYIQVLFACLVLWFSRKWNHFGLLLSSLVRLSLPISVVSRGTLLADLNTVSSVITYWPNYCWNTIYLLFIFTSKYSFSSVCLYSEFYSGWKLLEFLLHFVLLTAS